MNTSTLPAPAIASHTPGPWLPVLLETNHHGYEWPTFTVRSGSNVCLAVVGEVDRYTAEKNAANARLIAAAPELLEALKALMKQCEGYGEGKAWFGARVAAEAAIAKATANHES